MRRLPGRLEPLMLLPPRLLLPRLLLSQLLWSLQRRPLRCRLPGAGVGEFQLQEELQRAIRRVTSRCEHGLIAMCSIPNRRGGGRARCNCNGVLRSVTSQVADCISSSRATADLPPPRRSPPPASPAHDAVSAVPLPPAVVRLALPRPSPPSPGPPRTVRITPAATPVDAAAVGEQLAAQSHVTTSVDEGARRGADAAATEDF